MFQLNFKKLLFLTLIVWIALAIIFGVYDLQISIAVADQSSLWGNFGADYGEVPGYALIAIALATYIGGFFKNLRTQKVPAYISIIIGIFFIILGGDNTDLFTGLGLIVPVIIYVILTWNKDWSQYRKLAGIISLLALINPLMFVQLVKLFWGRVRFRDLAPSFVDYTPWFIPRGITGNYSFPSGHTAMGFMFLPLLILVKDRESMDPLKITLYLLVIGWGIFVALSRVAVGAHFSSDVLFSTGAAILTTILLYRKCYQNFD